MGRTGEATRRHPPTEAGLVVVTAGCWSFLILLRASMPTMPGAGAMSTMGDMGAVPAGLAVFAMPTTAAWTAADAMLMWVMWAVMMAAMMIPSATPMIRAYRAMVTSGGQAATRGSTPLFVGGYLLAWSGFAIAAAAAQWLLHDLALVDAMGVSTTRWTAGPVLVLAGAYQFSALKHASLGQCRAPLGFLLSEWRSGRRGAVVMGAHHGALCIGCCWALMALLFVLGVMNLWWIAVVATVVLLEKVTSNLVLPRALGLMLIAWGGAVLSGIINSGVSA